ncbi:MAG: GNAT family N-acetyltransferase, partial [Thermoleophilaceae bacterium]
MAFEIRPIRPADRAELAVAVVDAWHRRGVGTALLQRLAERAREEGIRRLSAEILTENRPMLDLTRALGEVRVTGRDAGVVRVEVALPPEGLGATLKRSLRASAGAKGHVRLRHVDHHQPERAGSPRHPIHKGLLVRAERRLTGYRRAPSGGRRRHRASLCERPVAWPGAPAAYLDLDGALAPPHEG